MAHMAEQSFEANVEDAQNLASLMYEIYTHPKPIISLIHGDVFGGGLGLVAASDIAICTESTRFCLSEVKLGLVPAVISPYVLRAMGERHFRKYALTAEIFDGAKAYSINLVHQNVKNEEDLMPALAPYQKLLCTAGPEALKTVKHLISVAASPIMQQSIEETSRIIASLRASSEGREGLKAFFEKRKPSWLTKSKGFDS
jgi:methylglutaconyl-CoA hydratase